MYTQALSAVGHVLEGMDRCIVYEWLNCSVTLSAVEGSHDRWVPSSIVEGSRLGK